MRASLRQIAPVAADPTKKVLPRPKLIPSAAKPLGSAIRSGNTAARWAAGRVAGESAVGTSSVQPTRTTVSKVSGIVRVRIGISGTG